MRWCCSCHCYASENHFGLAAFPNIFLLTNSVRRAFLSLHRRVLFKHLGPFSLYSFPHLALDFSYFFQLFSSSSFYSLFLSHLTMVSVHTVFSTFQFFCSCSLWPHVCTCAACPNLFCSCTFYSAGGPVPPLVLCSPLYNYIAHTSLWRKYTHKHDCIPCLFIAVLSLATDSPSSSIIACTVFCVSFLVAGDHSSSCLCLLSSGCFLIRCWSLWGGTSIGSPSDKLWERGRTLMWQG